MSHVTVLAGGGGAAKFLVGLVDVLPEEDIHIVVNVADDYETWGLQISPDIDRVLFTLAGEVDPHRGSSRADETYHCQDTIHKLGMPSETRIGDHELATQLLRSNLLRGGAKLDQVTSELADRFGIGARIMPATNDRVRSRIHHSKGSWSVREYVARDDRSDAVTGITYEGAQSSVAPAVVTASILEASRIILAPSDPVLSIGAILSVPGIRDALSRTEAGVVAISPVVGSQPVTGGAGRLMTVTGSSEVSARGVAERYQSFLGEIVIHTTDLGRLEQVREVGVGVWVENILINSLSDATRLASRVTNMERSVPDGSDRASSLSGS